MRDVIVIGGGAAGLMAAIAGARAGVRVMVLEHNQKPGRKLCATGNGKCNFTNRRQSMSEYRSGNKEIAWRVIEQFGFQDTIAFFEDLGILPLEKNGYFYPDSEQASSIVEALCQEAAHRGVTIKCGEHVTEILPEEDGYCVKTMTYSYPCRKVVLACGGQAGENLGNDGSGYDMVKGLGHHIVPLFPALMGLKTGNVSVQKAVYAKLAGIRRQAGVALYAGDLMVKTRGEVQFMAYGISGIPVFEVSRYASQALHNHQKVRVVLDLVPALSEEELIHFLQRQKECNGYKTGASGLAGILDKRLWEAAVFPMAEISKERLLGSYAEPELKEMAYRLKHLEMPVTGTNSFDKAQVTAGGVDLAEIDETTMESKLHPGFYLAGEILDVDGNCGGYNLQWAWASGFLAGRAAGEKAFLLWRAENKREESPAGQQ